VVEFTAHINSITIEPEKDGKLHFPDLYIHILDEGSTTLII